MIQVLNFALKCQTYVYVPEVCKFLGHGTEAILYYSKS